MRALLFNNSILRQGRCVELGLSLSDVALFDYLYQLSLSTTNTYIRTKDLIDDETYKFTFYVYVTYKKIMEDMPILKWGERSIRDSLTKLERLGIVKRYKFNNQVVNSKGHLIMPNARLLYLSIDPEPLLESEYLILTGQDTSLKNFVANRDINRSYEPHIKIKDYEYIYHNPGMKLSDYKLDSEAEEKFSSLFSKNLKALVTSKTYSYFNMSVIKIIDNATLQIKFFNNNTIKSIIHCSCYKIEQAIVDAYKTIETQKIILEYK